MIRLVLTYEEAREMRMALSYVIDETRYNRVRDKRNQRQLGEGYAKLDNQVRAAVGRNSTSVVCRCSSMFLARGRRDPTCPMDEGPSHMDDAPALGVASQ